MRLTRLNQLIDKNKTIQGTWRLSGNKIEYRREPGGKEVLLRGEWVSAAADSLAFLIREHSDQDSSVISRLWNLRGSWKADDKNQLTFFVQRDTQPDALTFEGGWETNKDQEIIYRFDGAHSLRFQGKWQIDSQKQLTYLLEGDSDSAFHFRGAFQTPSIHAKEGTIRYQIGCDLAGKRTLQKVTLFGKWKLSRALGLEFELSRPKEAAYSLRFRADYALGPRETISASLISASGKPLGYEVLFTREFLKTQGEAFVRLRSSLEETAVEGGFRFKW